MKKEATRRGGRKRHGEKERQDWRDIEKDEFE